MLMSMVVGKAFADDGDVFSYNNISYVVDHKNNKNVYVLVAPKETGSYSGQITINFSFSANNLAGYNGKNTFWVIGISDGAFSNCTGLTSLSFSGNTSYLTSIGEGAFSGCSNLISFTIPKTVESIGEGAFSGCSGLTTMTVASGNPAYKSIDDNCIIHKSSKTLIAGCKTSVIPDNASDVTIIGASAFKNISSLESIIIPSNIESIEDNAFNGCSGLNTVTSNCETAPTLGANAFSNIQSGSTLTIPAETLGSYIEKGWTNYFDISNLSGRVSITFTDPDETYTYNSSDHTPEVIVKDGNATLTKDTHYTVSYSDNINAGEATITITINGNRAQQLETHFTIGKADINPTV